MIVHKLGKKPAKIDARTLRLSKYLKAPLPAPPGPETSWVTHVKNWPMYLNDRLSDCVIAAMAHSEEQWETYANPIMKIPTDQDVLEAYEAVGGYRPDDPSTDQGCVMLDAMKYWRKTGIGDHKIDAFVSVDWTNLGEVKSAIWLFGNLMVGIELPLSAQGADKWTVPDGGIYSPDGKPGSWGGHGTVVVAMSPITFTCITWGQTLKLSHNFWLDYVSEAYASISTDWIEKSGVSPGNLDLAALKADLAELT